MGTPSHPRPHPPLEEALAELEQLTDEIRLKLHLASMEAKEAWTRDLEPRVLAARAHVHDAKEASQRTLLEIAKALRDFSASLYSP